MGWLWLACLRCCFAVGFLGVVLFLLCWGFPCAGVVSVFGVFSGFFGSAPSGSGCSLDLFINNIFRKPVFDRAQ